MTVEQMLASTPEYSFLKTNEHFSNKVIFLTYGGSYAYGTNTETSDIDIRGCALNSRSDILGLTNFETFVDSGTDTTIYSFNKLVSLLLNCNPNTIEMLGCRPEYYFVLTEIGKELIDNRKMFLSQKAVYSFGGYANSQLRRLENALARDTLSQTQKEKHILGSAETVRDSFVRDLRLSDESVLKLYIDESQKEDLDVEIFADISLKKFPVRDFSSILNELSNVISSYNQLSGRNKKKDNLHLNKHAMHLVRLYFMCLDILEKEDVITYREAEHDLLMSIRNGAFQEADGTYRPEFFELVNELEKRLEYAKQNTNLPKAPDRKKIEDFVMSVNERSL